MKKKKLNKKRKIKKNKIRRGPKSEGYAFANFGYRVEQIGILKK